LTTTDPNRVPAVRPMTGVELPLQSIANTIDNGINSFSNGLRTLVPARRLEVIRHDRVDASGAVTNRGQRLLVYSIEARTTGANIRFVPDEQPLPGGGDMLVILLMDGSLRVRGRLEGNFDILGVSHGIDTDVAVRVDTRGLRIRLRPFVDFRNGQGRLGLRIVRAEVMRTLSRDGSGEPANNTNLTLESSSQLPTEFFDFVRAFLFTHLFVPELGPPGLGQSEGIIQLLLENLKLFPLSTSGGELALGDIVTAIPFTDPIGPLLFGEEILPFFQNTRLEGVAIQRADDFSTGAPRAASLGLYARRPPPPPRPLSNRTARVATLLHTAGTALVCDFLEQQNGDCLESTTDPTTCLR